MLTWFGISLGAYMGALLRVGISYFRIRRIESNFTVMYAQILGCVVMGFATHHKTIMTAGSRFNKV